MNTKILIVSHSSGIEGPIDYYEQYLLKNSYHVSKLEHPLNDYDGRKSIFFVDGKEVSSRRRMGGGLVNLILDLLISAKYTLRTKPDIFVGANNFDAVIGIICRKILLRKRIKKIIYFASDFSEERYKNKILDFLYYGIEKIALRYSDEIISNTKRAEKKRQKLGLDVKKSKVIPNGVYIQNPSFPKKNINKEHFVFVGSVTKEHGLYDLIDAMQGAISHLVIIGRGDDWDRTLNSCHKKDISLETYHNKSHEFVIEYLKKFSGMGLAPYNLESKWTLYCSPLKVSEYIACGVPVIMSGVPEIAETVKDAQLGIVYEKIDSEEIKKKVREFDADIFEERAKRFYGEFNSENLLKKIAI